MKKKNLPENVTPCCEFCEYFSRLPLTGETLCQYKNRLKKIDENDVCRRFSFNIFSYKPQIPPLPKAFDFTKI